MSENMTDQEIIEDMIYRIEAGGFDIKDIDYSLVGRVYRIGFDQAKRLVPVIKNRVEKVN